MTDREQEAIELAAAVTAAVEGRYVIGDVVGYGRWGLTMRARDVSGRMVALKVAWRDEESRQQLLRETELTARVDHSNILVPRRVDVPEPLLAVETTLMAGSLGDYLDAGSPVPFEKVRDVLLAIGPALDKAHSVGVVHGGILPEKIFIDDNGRYFIGDFSLRLPQAVFIEGNRPSLVGFAAYTPMEQRHDLPSSDGRIDEFSLAVVAYELLRGERRWRLGDEGVLEIDSVDMGVSRPIAPGVPATASAAIRRATSREAAFRYPTVGEFVRSFAGLLHGGEAAEQIFRRTAVVQTRRRWLWLVPTALGIAALFGFRPVVRDSVIRLWHADWASRDFWHGNVETSAKPATDVGVGPRTKPGAPTPRSTGTGTAPSSTRRDDGRAAASATTNPGPNIDLFPRAQPQGRATVTGSSRGPDSSTHSSLPSKDTLASRVDDAAQNLSGRGAPPPRKAAEKGTGTVEVKIEGAGEAQVYIDGRNRGRAPVTWQGSVGKHVVMVRPASMFAPGLIEVTITAGTTTRAVFTTR